MNTLSSMSFRRFGRSFHLEIRNAADLARIAQLDRALWLATAAPTDSLNMDPVFLTSVDMDGNGRILCFELIEAVRWLLDVLRDPSDVAAGAAALRLDAVNGQHPDGQTILTSARKMLAALGQPEADRIDLDQVRRVRGAEESRPVSGAGVVLPEAADDPDIRQFLRDAVAATGGVPHPAGAKGVNKATVETFLREVRACLEWLTRAAPPENGGRTAIMPLGDRTPRAQSALAAVRAKLDQYFAHCRLAALTELASSHIQPDDRDLDAADLSDPEAIDAWMRGAPLATPGPDRVLRFESQINPAYARLLSDFRRQVAEPVLGGAAEELSEEDWNRIKARFEPHEAWLAARTGAAVEGLGREKLERYLRDTFRYEAGKLIDESASAALALDRIKLTEKLILYQANLLPLANNMVSFPYLYDPDSRASFEMGSLVMDGRHFNFSVRVHDRQAHAAQAGTSNMFVLYVEVTPGGGGRPFEVAVPVTAGTRGNLCVGKRGVFIDTRGRQYDARAVQIIENPISLGEAMASPFVRLGRLLTGRIEAMTAAAEKKLDTSAQQALEGAPAPAGAGAEPQAATRLAAGGLLAGGGVAAAALGSAAVYAAKAVASIGAARLLLGVGGALLAVALPISLMALIKLRRRDLSAILEGAGWAINARMRLTLRQGRVFTRCPRVPVAAPARRRRRRLYGVLAAVLLGALLLRRCTGRAEQDGDRARRQRPAPALEAVAPDN